MAKQILLAIYLVNLSFSFGVTLVGPDGKPYTSNIKGAFGGNRRLKLYGALDCASALRHLANGFYAPHRVFFRSEADAIRAGYHPCFYCLGGNVALRTLLGNAFVLRRAQTFDLEKIEAFFQTHDTFSTPSAERLLSSIERRELHLVLSREDPDSIAGMIGTEGGSVPPLALFIPRI